MVGQQSLTDKYPFFTRPGGHKLGSSIVNNGFNNFPFIIFTMSLRDWKHSLRARPHAESFPSRLRADQPRGHITYPIRQPSQAIEWLRGSRKPADDSFPVQLDYIDITAIQPYGLHPRLPAKADNNRWRPAASQQTPGCERSEHQPFILIDLPMRCAVACKTSCLSSPSYQERDVLN